MKELRRLGYKTPIMLLTAKSELEDQILGLDSGADDYLPKPFSMDLLLAHVRALLRRRPDYISQVLTFGNVELDQESHDLFESCIFHCFGSISLCYCSCLHHDDYSPN